MPDRDVLLQRLRETAAQLIAFFQNPSAADTRVNELWTAQDVLAHLTFWHESFARNVSDLTHGKKPAPLKGRLMDLNQGGVDGMRAESLEAVLGRFQKAQQIIEENILDPRLALIPYRKGSRDYTPEEHLEIVEAHIRQHFSDARKALKQKP
jgi:hypothetical protein